LRITYQEWFSQGQDGAKSIAYLLPLAFTGGLIAVFPPAILGLLPNQNLSYIGTRIHLTARRLQAKAGWYSFWQL